MTKLIKLAIKNPVFVNLLMVTIIVLGAISYWQLPRELMPKMNFNWAFIITVYPGTSPEEIEQLITIPMEDEIADVDGIQSINSDSSEGRSAFHIRFDEMSKDEFEKRFRELKDEVDKLQLPQDAEEPIFLDFTSSDFIPMVNVVIRGDLPEIEMREIAEDLRDDILDIKHVAQVEVAGTRDREIWIEVDPQKLNSYNMALTQVADSIRTKNLNLPAGTIDTGRSEFIVRTIGEVDKAQQIENVIIRSGRFSDYVRIKDIAEVKDTFEKHSTKSRLDSKTSITLTVAKKDEGNSIKTVDRIKDIVKEYEEKLPSEISIRFIGDTSIFIKQTIHDLQINAWLGMIGVLFVLYMIIGWRNAMLAGIGLPVIFMATFIFMYKMGSSINGNSLFGLVLVLGMLVDDAIVILENSYRYFQKGYSSVKAAFLGTKEVMAPVSAAVLTTIAAFLPLMLMSGVMGQYLRVVPIVVSLALIASLIEALFILPSHFAEWSGKPPKKNPKKNWRDYYFSQLSNHYSQLLKKVLKYRYFVVSGIIIIFLLSGIIVPMMGVEMYEGEEFDVFSILLRMPVGTSLESTNKVVSQIEKLAMSLPRQEWKSVLSTAGLLQGETEWWFTSNVGQVLIELVDKKSRNRSMDDIINQLREEIESIAGIESIEFLKIEMKPPLGFPVEAQILGKDLNELNELTERLKKELSKIPGVYDIKDNFEPGKKEMKIIVDEEKASLLGLDIHQIAFAVRNAVEGTVATVFRDADEEIDVIVKFRKEDRQSLTDIENMKIVNRAGKLVPFKEVASIKVEPGYNKIYRYERERSVTVTANVDEDIIPAVKVNQKLEGIFNDISRAYNSCKLHRGGEFEEFKDTFSSLLQLFSIGVLLIFLILATQFRSFFQPFIVLFTIPFAFIGAMIGLLVIRSPFSITTMYAIVALAGVAVNDAIVLISFINNSRARGESRWKSIILAGKTRLRPVLLTSITTIFGLLPMAIGIGGKSAVWAPMATTIVWGLAFATIMTLFAIPSLYAIMDDIKKRVLKGRFMTPDGRLVALSDRGVELD